MTETGVKLIVGDCLSEIRKMKDNSVDVIVTSPPYNLNIKYNEYQDNRPYNRYLLWLQDVFIELERVLTNDGSFFLNVGFSSTSPWIAFDVANMAKTAFKLQNTIIWVKSISINNNSYGHFKPINSKRFLNNQFEYIFHFTESGKVPIDRLSIGVPYADKSNIKRWNGKKDIRCRGNVWYIPYDTITSKKERGNHPATFPVELPERCIKLHGVNRTHLVLDPFVGTGTTVVAAKKLGIQSIGIDVDRTYIETATRRTKNEV